MSSQTDIERLRVEFARRASSEDLKDRYSWFDRAYLFGTQQRYRSRRITLAPPIARCVVPLSWTIGLLFESIKLLNSHYLVGIRKRPVPQ
jgi:hypothetical protein